jgi:hypothetical protein
MAKKKKTDSKPKPLLISIKKCAYILNLYEQTLESWITEKKIISIIDEHGQRCISYEDFKRLANDESKFEKANLDLVKYLVDRSTWNVDKMKIDIEAMLNKYREYVDLITKYHAELINTNFILNSETSLNASLLLFLKIINMSNMFLDSIEKSYNSAVLIIRTIDEANTLAQYFIVLQNNEQCKKDLLSWLRYEKSPSPAECREKLSKVLAPFAGIPAELLEKLYDDLYDVKSKAVHHSYRDCSELIEFELKENEAIIKSISYKVSSIYRQYEVVTFFESIINNVMQGFLLCFNSLLSEEKKNNLIVLTTALSFKN